MKVSNQAKMSSIQRNELDWEVEYGTAYKLRSSSAQKLFELRMENYSVTRSDGQSTQGTRTNSILALRVNVDAG
jgi:hypothetical protein